MSEEKFTPGPWDVRKGGNFTQIWCEGHTEDGQPSDYLIGEANYRQSDVGSNTRALSHANAHLIASAPDLYKILESVQERWHELQRREVSTHEFECCIYSIGDVLAKARGE